MAKHRNNRPLRILAFGALVFAAVLATAGVGAAQQDGTTSTTQLDLGGDDTSTTTAPDETTTTQLDLGGDDAEATTTTQLDIAGDSVTSDGGVEPPTRIDAGAGGTASTSETPRALAFLAASLAVIAAAATWRLRRTQHLPQ